MPKFDGGLLHQVSLIIMEFDRQEERGPLTKQDQEHKDALVRMRHLQKQMEANEA